MKTLRILTMIMIAFTLVFTSCERDDNFTDDNSDTPDDTVIIDDNNDPTDTGNLDQFFGSAVNRDFFGQVVDENNNAIQGALVKVGALTVFTDDNGIFSAENASVNEQFAYLRVTASGYVTSGRALRPSDGINRVKIMLLSADVTATVNSGSPETVQLGNGTSVALPGAYIDENGNAYSGAVDVILDYLDPASADLDAVMPGMLYAEDAAGDEAYLETFGMISVELRDTSGNELNIDPNNPAELRFPLDPALQGVAPATIPLWSFNDELGYWIEDGEAVLQGNEYVGQVSHFSFWNCDAPFPVVDFCTTVLDDNGNALANTTVTITSPNTPYPRSGVTDQNGQVCGKVPSGLTMTIEVVDLCGNPVFSDVIGPFAGPTTYGPISVNPGSSTSQQVIGNFNDCSNNPITNGYVVLEYGGSVFYEPVTAGTFDINLISCPASNTFTLEAIDIVNQQSSGIINYTFTPPTTTLGTITSCNAVSEYIEWEAEGVQRFLTSPINTYDNGNNFSVNASNGNEFFYISSSDTAVGTYTWGNGQQAPPGSFEMEMYEVLSQIDIDYNAPINITFQLNAFGAVGDYIDITFSGTYSDNSAMIQPISGSLHVIRD
ncbi:Ig-like domain-containing protein [Dokdonia pacifica]|uniref:Carboxypeptidase regulatory-like domain-containing protein n=1 Tax=Dokdonia pacifica TaxID=1627892 RepID=A0A239B028_9FLAO|nr:Ig-like domain-containing protein [Dokdonia pacifica]SNS01325.1 hypothetical protein SAMN06265376_105258 [Dokdonia pacifica]